MQAKQLRQLAAHPMLRHLLSVSQQPGANRDGTAPAVLPARSFGGGAATTHARPQAVTCVHLYPPGQKVSSSLCKLMDQLKGLEHLVAAAGALRFLHLSPAAACQMHEQWQAGVPPDTRLCAIVILVSTPDTSTPQRPLPCQRKLQPVCACATSPHVRAEGRCQRTTTAAAVTVAVTGAMTLLGHTVDVEYHTILRQAPSAAVGVQSSLQAAGTCFAQPRACRLASPWSTPSPSRLLSR